MADLNFIDKQRIEDIFGMSSGYVLDLSAREFKSLFGEVANIDIFDDKYDWESGSKANRLRAFLELESSYLVGKILSALLEQWKFDNRGKFSHSLQMREKYKECKTIANKLLHNKNTEDVSTDKMQQLGHHFIAENIKKCDDKIKKGDYSGSITNSRSLIETILIYLSKELNIDISNCKGNLRKLYTKIAKTLNLSNNKNDDDSVLKITSGFYSIIEGLSEISNNLSDRHGKDITKNYKVQSYHSILAVNSAKTISEFLISSYEKQKK